MWFQLLTLATFLALGSCRGYFSLLRGEDSKISNCTGPGCPCICPDDNCPPCPAPIPMACLTSCGTSECPCLGEGYNQRGENNQSDSDVNFKALSIVTINIFSTGPICSGFLLLPNMVVTMGSCIAGKKKNEIFVTVRDKGSDTDPTRPLDVAEIEVYPYNSNFVDPVILILEKSDYQAECLAPPPLPVEENLPAEIHKWQVLEEGREYHPLRISLTAHAKCKDSNGDFICATTPAKTVMGWNDIGTPLVEERHQDLVVQAIYMGHDLYQSSSTIKYLALFRYSPWFYRLMDKYS